MKIFVARLDYSVSSDELKTVFEEYGSVTSCSVVLDKETGRSRGFGFVEMSDEDANLAIRQLDQSEIRGRDIVVKPAEDKKR